jgi:hypothetical protein
MPDPTALVAGVYAVISSEAELMVGVTRIVVMVVATRVPEPRCRLTRARSNTGRHPARPRARAPHTAPATIVVR